MTGQLDRIQELADLFASSESSIPENIAAVVSGKGGTGKTFFAANLAYQYSLSHKVLLIDADFNLSNQHILFNENPQNTLNLFLDSKCRFDEIITKHNENLHVIFGDSGSVHSNNLSFNQLEKFLTEVIKLSTKYDLILFDLGAGLSEENFHILSKAKLKIIVTNPEPTALMDAYVLVKLLKNNDYHDGIYITINRCVDEEEGKEAYKNLRSAVDHFLKTDIKFLVDIPETPEVRKSIISQKLFAQYNKSNSVISALNTAANKISKIHQVFNINQPAI